MKCPVCKTADLNPNELEPGLGSMKCPNCAGNWIVESQYWKWLEQHGPTLPEIKSQAHDLTLSDSQEPLDCPECRWRMVKYKVGHETGFSLDHCHSCKGIW